MGYLKLVTFSLCVFLALDNKLYYTSHKIFLYAYNFLILWIGRVYNRKNKPHQLTKILALIFIYFTWKIAPFVRIFSHFSRVKKRHNNICNGFVSLCTCKSNRFINSKYVYVCIYTYYYKYIIINVLCLMFIAYAYNKICCIHNIIKYP